MTETSDELIERLLAGEKIAVARLISWAENSDPRFAAAINRLYERVGRAWRVGITGPPGVGKSTLVNEIARKFRERDETVGILAIDPSSPLSGGALLGDRIRMEERTLDAGVFIRSMASRDSHGGLARAAIDACDVMDAFGFDEILVETVGVGQAEYDVVAAADTVLVVLCPGAGDGIQAMKAGLLEVADVLVVNKFDLPGADRLVLDLEESVHIRPPDRSSWTTPVVECSAGTGKGIETVLDAVDRHRAWLGQGRLEEARRAKRVEQVKRALSERLVEHVWGPVGAAESVQSLIAAGEAPYDVAERLFAELSRGVLPDRVGDSGSTPSAPQAGEQA